MSAKPSKGEAGPLKISQVAEQADVSKQTVEYYILLGLIHPRTDPKTRRRLFTADDVKRVRLIKQLNQSGYTLREIRQTWFRGKK